MAQPLNGSMRSAFRYPERLNAAALLLDEGAARAPEATAVVSSSARMTYAQLATRVERFAGGLKQAGLERGERIVIRMRNTPEAAVALLASVRLGAVAVPLFDSVPADELSRIVALADAVAIVAHGDSFDAVGVVAQRCSTLRFTAATGGHPRASHAFEAIEHAASHAPPPADTRRDDLALLCFSSGTTATPKGLPHTHQNLIAVADSAVPLGLSGLAPGDVVLSTSPFGFAFGLAAMILYPLRFGAAAVYSERRMEPGHVFELLETQGVTHLLTVPTLCARMLAATGGTPRRFPRLRVVKVGGMPATIELQTRFHDRFGVEMLGAFGMQELIGSAISCYPQRFKRGALGLPQPGCEARVLDPEGAECAPGEPGRLALRAPFCIPYYWKDKASTRRHLTADGWLLTDDIVLRDAEGFYFHVGRADQTIISAGWSIGPAELEAALASHPAVAEAAVLALPDAERGAAPVAAVVRRSAPGLATVDAAELVRHLRERLAPYKVPREIHFVDALPRTRTGKIALAALRATIDERRAAQAAQGDD